MTAYCADSGGDSEASFQLNFTSSSAVSTQSEVPTTQVCCWPLYGCVWRVGGGGLWVWKFGCACVHADMCACMRACVFACVCVYVYKRAITYATVWCVCTVGLVTHLLKNIHTQINHFE